MKAKGKPHPSGKPIRNSWTRPATMTNIPDTGYLTPRLRTKALVDLVGFHHIQPDTEEYEDE